MVETLGDALPAEIKRVQAQRERWLGYAKDAGPQANFGPMLFLMQRAIDEGVASLASGDVVRMIAAHQVLKDFDSDD